MPKNNSDASDFFSSSSSSVTCSSPTLSTVSPPFGSTSNSVATEQGDKGQLPKDGVKARLHSEYREMFPKKNNTNTGTSIGTVNSSNSRI